MPTPKVFVLQPFGAFDAIYHALVAPAVTAAGATSFRVDEIARSGRVIEQIYSAIEGSDLIVADVTGSNPNVMYELGYAHALRKPVVLISQRAEHSPFDLAMVRIVHYDNTFAGVAHTQGELPNTIRDALAHPETYSGRPATNQALNSVFISYSHRDKDYLVRALVHLKPLERKGIVDIWADTRLTAGDKWKSEIAAALSRARVAVLLVSADFLASDFIVDNELPPLLEQAEKRGTRIVPLILKPCRFTRDDGLRAFQALNNPSEPLSLIAQDQQEVHYDRVSELIEQLFPSSSAA